jgi:flagella basal body P-ring formation protein FlgA
MNTMTLRSRIGLSLAAGLLALFAGMSASLSDEVVLVPNRVIYPGETIAMSALKAVTLLPGKQAPNGVLTLAEQLDGKIARRTLLPGRYVADASVRNAHLVEQGASVQAIFTSGGLTISATAVTLQPGGAGDQVRVRNIDSGKIFTGTVMADGSILVGAT